jgi:hypothetical protein
MMRITRKLVHYAAMGVSHIRVIDPASKNAWRFRDSQLILMKALENRVTRCTLI